MRIAVIGLGKLGSPLAAVFAGKGHSVCGCDRNYGFVEKLSKGIAPVEETGLQKLLDETGPIQATTNLEEAVEDAEIIFVIVPTLSLNDGSFSVDYVRDVLLELATLKDSGLYQVITIVSTLSPGSMKDLLSLYESSSGRKCGEDFGLIYSPEFIALGSVINNLHHPSFILIGEEEKKSGDILTDFYDTIHSAPTKRMSFVSAEIAKLSVNVALTQKISYANTISELCENYKGADAAVVLDAVGTDARIGNKYLSSGTAFGGPCFPRDCRALTAASDKVACQSWMAQAADQVNTEQTDRIEQIIYKVRPQKRIGILGVAYKPDTHVTEESAGVALQKRLEERNYAVLLYDPQIKGVELGYLYRECDVLVVMSPCKEFRQLNIPEDLTSTVVDAWGIVDQTSLPSSVKYICLGVKNERT